jgi:ADP-heptose:LPS heptosyltransferase
MSERCLRSVLDNSPQDIEVIATDNASTDGTGEWLRAMAEQDARIIVVTNTENRGVSGPKREACERAKAPLFVSIDNDAWAGAGWLDALRGPLDADPHIAQVGRGGQNQSLRHDGIGTTGGPVEYIDGSCFMTRTSVANELGLCDRFFPFAYGDDSDYSLRLRARGWKIAVVDGAPIWHPHEYDKQAHGGLDLGPHLALATRRMMQRWRDYFNRHAFDPTIIVRRSAAIGDVVIATALPRRVKTMLPQARIFFTTLLPDLLRGNPYIESIVPPQLYPRQAPRMAYAWDLDGVYEARLDRPYWKSFAEATMFAPEDATPTGDLHPDNAAKLEAERLVGTATRLAVVAPQRTGWAGKDIGPDAWADAIAELQRRGYTVAETSGTQERLTGADLHIGGCTTLMGLAAVLGRAQLFLGLDSGPYHIARAMGCPTVAFFGCTLQDIVSDGNLGTAVSVPGLDCLGCHHRQRPGTTSFQGCARGDLACLGLHPHQIREAVVEVLDRLEAGEPEAVAV